MALFRRKNAASTEEAEPVTVESMNGTRKKGAPTPTRKQAEAARRERLTKPVDKKEAARLQRSERQKAMAARDNTPEKALARDYVDSKRHIGEFLLPGMIVILGATFAYQVAPAISMYATVLMYVFIGAVVIDLFFMWRGFKKLLAQRLPKSSSRGLMFYLFNRSIQIRRFRMPAPRIKRGDSF
ncbi:MAG: DUF3043 domain-containing protein [Microlunatus sp.]|nr:DUF3043 domain-containing protein [Microlunatus sp.]